MIAMFWDALKFGAFNMTWIFVVLWGVERLWPRGEQPSRSDIARAMKYWGIYAVVGALVAALFGFAQDQHPLILVPAKDWPLAVIAAPLLFMATYDFFNYWMHRAQHKWFWRQHSVHHSIEHLSGVNSYFHPTEHLFRLAFISAPMTFLLGVDAGTSVITITLLTAIQGNYLHSCTRLHLGPLSAVFADNRWHRIHHSIEREHFDKNFGTAMTLWDRLFRTAYFPVRDEWPVVGVHDTPEHQTLRGYLLLGLLPNETVELARSEVGRR